ncbi:DUF3307 domain-containing protein [Galbibacter pacificus]|uniref:DUF3307 domain-containing protein n=1 Tax=Galbibacter pacificus TaxID=2996052 RepID=A0ABT6FP05_9FLAO|nr:DUF3307 domain-containing protein [Galbibacter pacificus]MDG3581515.1 DUF3307 domain-containing protein [Galbibacter pacificus]MDG3584993.1 DUF3307 domain-containing protein [Galbibacter pacificus]
MELFLKLFLAHLLGDFTFQSKKWVAEKEEKKLRSGKLYLHVLLHSVLAALFVWDINLWYIPLIIGISHFFIDAGKLLFQTENNKRLLFFVDQILHIAVILIICLLNNPSAITIEDIFGKQFLLIVSSIIFLTHPTSIIIKTLISIYTPKTEMDKGDSLENAGKYIGMLERLLVFVFIVTNHWEGVGFLIAAKSIFRFSDLTEAKDRKLTEYILIGTLLSFGIAIMASLLFIFFS